MSNEQPWAPQNQPGPPPYGYPGGAGHPGPQPPMGPPHLPPLAEWWERWVARLIDGIVFMVANLIVSSILFSALVPIFAVSVYGVLAGAGLFLLYLVNWVVSGFLYGAYDHLMHARSGQTLGKMAMKIRVATVDGRPLSQQVLLRRSAAYPGVFVLIGLLAGLSWSAATLGVLLAIGLSLADGIPIITDQRLHQALHDRFAGTVVIKAQ
jgi:uncharacterized RDD family membrane protein YckC